jgi:hypothetical protein
MLGRGNPSAYVRCFEATWHVDARTPRDSSENLVSISSEDLVQLLLRSGAKTIARQEHGVLLQAEHRLIFLRHAPVVDKGELVDALRSADIGPGRFDRLLAEMKSDSAVGI